jgi:seryl-tRNA synthetase
MVSVIISSCRHHGGKKGKDDRGISMLDMKLLENEPDHVKERLALRGEVPGIDELLELLAQRRHDIKLLQDAQHQRNEASNAMKSASKEEIAEKRGALKELSHRIKEMESKERELEAAIHERLLFIPNLPGPRVPKGASEDDNVETRRVLEPQSYDFEALDHVAIAEHLGIMDQERAAKVSGSRFSFLQGYGSKLNRALINFMADFHTERGDTELTPPFIVRSESMRGTGQLPKFAHDAFSIPHGEGEPFYLIPTAEVPVTNYLADEIIPQEKLPLRFCAYSPCFRAEAGAAGKDTRGLIRQHQFEKVEMVRFATPEQSEE